jgi:hypothetical protein
MTNNQVYNNQIITNNQKPINQTGLGIGYWNLGFIWSLGFGYWLLFFMTLCLFASPAAQAATYYLDPVNGHDANSGLSADQAWHTFNRAIETYSGNGAKVTKGDTVILMPGQYASCVINYTPPVESKNWSEKITYQAQVPRTAIFSSATSDTVTIMGDYNRYLEFNGIQFACSYSGTLSTPLKLETSSFIHFVNCEFVGFWDDGLDQASFLKTTEVGIRITRALGVNSLMQGIVVENCEIHQVRQGILVLAALGLNDPESDSVFKIKDTIIHTTCRSPIDFRETTHTYKPYNSEVDPPDAGLMHGVIIIEGNHLYNQQAKNADGNGDWTHGSGMALATNNLIIRNNIIHSVGSTAGIGLYDIDAPGYLPKTYYEDIAIENNLIYDTISSHALELSNIGDGRVVVKNNTIIGFYDVGTDWKRYGAVVWIYATNGYTGSGLEFFNNIVVGSVIEYTGFNFADGKEDYNRIYSVWAVGQTPTYPTKLKGDNTIIYCPGNNTNFFESGFFPNSNYSRGTDFVRYKDGGPHRLMLNDGYTSPLPGIGYKAVSDIIFGDLSGDSALTAYDAALAARIAVGLDAYPAGDKLTIADVSGDKQVTAYDAALIAQRVVGLIDRFPVEE